ncbi:2-C-methyl-D-erythritol 4-phosphate cytidylyltransferase [bioreactor metagenome]|uniref:2-C-methyl-D-erythritol 4-phosphate cytidylyltransferase n=1 Tax=bioreactor metagenome TaxID=1076179 RepID=A0A644XYB9_9ZZZZ
MNTAVILAAGKGTRMNMSINKLYLNIKGKPLLARTLDVFFACSSIHEIVLVIREDEDELCREKIICNMKNNKPLKLVIGGKERQDSVYNGIKSADQGSELILIHDGARPFVTQAMIEESIREAKIYKAVAVGMPVKDTIKRVGGNGVIVNTPDRSGLWIAQTPQTFARNTIVQAYELSYRDKAVATDDAMLVERMGLRVRMIRGSYDNIKITTPEDMALAEEILESGRVGNV